MTQLTQLAYQDRLAQLKSWLSKTMRRIKLPEQLKRIGDWQLTQEARRSALADLLNAIAQLDTALG